MHASTVRRRGGVALALIVGLVIGTTVLSGTAYPAGQGAAPVNIADPEEGNLLAQVTPEGALEVAGQVDVTGTSAVDVNNFPATQEVSGTVTTTVPVVSDWRTISFGANAGGGNNASFGTINARFISIASDDEVFIRFWAPAGPPDFQSFLAIRVGDNRQPTQQISLPIAVPLNFVSFSCDNESSDCQVEITILG